MKEPRARLAFWFLSRRIWASLLLTCSLWFYVDDVRGEGVLQEDAIVIGNLMPYTGPASDYATIGRAEAAYFDLVNATGGINGRKVRFVTYDDSYDPVQSIRLTRKLVEEDRVLLMFGSVGTASNYATRPYLNERKVPQLFVASGSRLWTDSRDFPWTIGWQPTYASEGRLYARFIQEYFSDAKIGVLWQNDVFGKELYVGLQEGMGDQARMIVGDAAFDLGAKSMQTQIAALKDAGATILVVDGAPSMCALALEGAARFDWHPVVILSNTATSVPSAIKPAGALSVDVISTSYLKDPSDPAWKDDTGMELWTAFMDRYFPEGDKSDVNAVFGYAIAKTLEEVLRRCGNDLSRENVLKQATSLKDYRNEALLPGIAITTGPADYRPIEQMRLMQLDGTAWRPIGDIEQDR